MKSHLEIEYKTLITKQQFLTLINHFKEASCIHQTNIYFDTTPSLKERGMACRIRQIKNQYIFTLKIKQEAAVQEIETVIDSLSLDHPSISEILTTYSISELHECGRLDTVRHQVSLAKGDLCIDANTYNGKEDFEVEYELHDGIENDLDFFIGLLHQFSIQYTPNKVSKIERCLSTK